MYLVKAYKTREGIRVGYELVHGHISAEGSICLRDEYGEYWIPCEISNCIAIKRGSYHNEDTMEIYCFIEDVNFCMKYLRDIVLKDIQEEVERKLREIEELKSMEVIISKESSDDETSYSQWRYEI